MILTNEKNLILQSYAASVRWDVFRLWKKWGDVFSGALSIVDLYVAFYLEYRVKYFNDSLDKIPRVIPKDSSVPALFSVIAHSGLLNAELLENEYPPEFDQTVPGIDAVDGNLGHSLSQAVGLAMAGKIRDEQYLVFCFMGDGELQEGIDHAAKYAATMRLNNLCVVVDCNQIQSHFYTTDADHTMQQGKDGSFEKLNSVWLSYGWDVIECDGHNFDQILDSYKQAGRGQSPLVILAKTIKGRGFPKIEGKLLYAHGIKEPQLIKEAEEYFLQKKRTSPYEVQYGSCSYISKRNKYPKVILPTSIIEKTDKSLYDTFVSWIKEFTERNPKKVITLNTDNTKLVGGRNTIFFSTEHYSPHIFLGLNERFAVNFGRGLSHEGIYPIFTSPAVHLTNTIDDWRSACMDKDPILICGFASGSALYEFGKTHLSYQDIQMYRYPDAHIYQPATHEDLILILNEVYTDPKNTLPGYIRLHNLGREEEYNLHLNKESNNEPFKDGFYIIKSSKYSSNAPNYVVIIVSGILLKEAIGAGRFLEEKGISYIIVNFINLTEINKEKFQNITQKASLIISLIDGATESLSTLIFKYLHEEKRFVYVPLGIDGWGSFDPPYEVYRKSYIDAESIFNCVLNKIQFRSLTV